MVMKLMIMLELVIYQNNDEIDSKLNKRLIGSKINNNRVKEKLIILD